VESSTAFADIETSKIPSGGYSAIRLDPERSHSESEVKPLEIEMEVKHDCRIGPA